MAADPRIFLIGYMDADEHPYLADYLDWYLRVLCIPPAHVLIGVRSDPEDTNAPLMRCNEIFNRYNVPRWSEVFTDVDIVTWRRNEQDTYVLDEDWVIHAKLGDLIDFEWTGGSPVKLAEWMDLHEFDCVTGSIVERFAIDRLPIGKTPWELYPFELETPERRVAMARGYWYVCDDGRLCPQFEASAWDFPRQLRIHRFTYQIRPGASQATHNA